MFRIRKGRVAVLGSTLGVAALIAGASATLSESGTPATVTPAEVTLCRALGQGSVDRRACFASLIPVLKSQLAANPQTPPNLDLLHEVLLNSVSPTDQLPKTVVWSPTTTSSVFRIEKSN